MSTETIVNRISQVPVGQQLDGELEDTVPAVQVTPIPVPKPLPVPAHLYSIDDAPTMDQLPVEDVVTGVTVSREVFSEKLNQVIDHQAQALGAATPAPVPVEEPEDNIGNVAPAPAFDVASALTSLIVTRTEFEKFRTQTIMALKHMGVDVRKYFPE